MVVEISPIRNGEAKILTLTAVDYHDQQVLEEIVKTKAYISADYTPYTATIKK